MDRRELHVVEVELRGRPGLGGRVGRDSDQRFRAQQLPRCAGRHGVEAQVDAVGGQGACDVDPAVHEEPDRTPPLAGPLTGGLGELPRQQQQWAAVELPLADLHPVHPRRHRRPHRLGEGMAGAAAVGHQAEDRPRCGQKVASPSRGLDAVA